MERTRWYKDAVIYQIYPRSFCDSNGDGIGDIRGIISKLDYLKDLGINAVWLSPVYKSPNADNGYDISDYRDIMDEFGTLDDFQEMVDGMHQRGIKLIMDLVVNHTSDEHKWFIESKKSLDNPYRDYYIWRKGRGKNGKKPPNNWTSRFGGSAWEYDETTNEWYLHLFNVKQPDLNWDNSKVREEVKDICRYWLDKGVDGFRCDVITYISKTEGLPNGKELNPFLKGDMYFNHGPNIHRYLNELNRDVLSNYDCMTVGEGPYLTATIALDYVTESRNELDTVFHFEHTNNDMFMQVLPKKWTLSSLKTIFDRWQNMLDNKGWNSLYLENHDQPRSIGRFANDKEYRVESAKMLANAMHFQKGTPYVYQGQEIGMTNHEFKSLDEMVDVMALTVCSIIDKVPLLKKPLRKIALKALNYRARDQARMPMQWDSSEKAGFTTGEPWFMINPNHTEINVEAAEADENSILNYYKKLIRMRTENTEVAEILKFGDYTDLSPLDENIYAYSRSFDGKKILIVCNFKEKNISYHLPTDYLIPSSELLLTNYPDTPASLTSRLELKPYESRVYIIR